jgi:phosphate transport system substrate-binding protein
MADPKQHNIVARRILGKAIGIGLGVLLLAFTPWFANSQESDSRPSYRPEQQVSGTIRSWGDKQMAPLLEEWEKGFSKFHGNVRFEGRLKGTDTGMAGVYSEVADLAFMGRPAGTEEVMAFEWVFRYKPLGIQVATGGLDAPGKTAALEILVNAGNPISKLTLAQVDAIFGAEHKRGPQNIRQWGDLGLSGEWASKPIHTYGYALESDVAGFFRTLVLKNSFKWNPDLQEFNPGNVSGSANDAGKAILEALSRDPYGITFSTAGYGNPKVKAVALASQDTGPFYEPNKENLMQGTYPLTRVTWVYTNRAPGKPIDPKVKEFLRYILSREGQQDVLRQGDYLPLTDQVVREQLRKLE